MMFSVDFFKKILNCLHLQASGMHFQHIKEEKIPNFCHYNAYFTYKIRYNIPNCTKFY